MLKKAVAGTVVVLCLVSPAFADTDALKDPKNDMKFDIARISQSHGRERADERAWLKHTVEFREGFSEEAFRKVGELHIFFTSHDRSIKVVNRRDEWKAQMTTNGSRFNHPEVWRPDGRTIRLSFPPRWIEKAVDRYRWKALSVFNGVGCSGSDGATCPDPAPADMTGGLRHVL